MDKIESNDLQKKYFEFDSKLHTFKQIDFENGVDEKILFREESWADIVICSKKTKKMATFMKSFESKVLCLP